MRKESEPSSDPSLKAIDILEAYLDCGKAGLGVTEVTQMTGLNKSTVHRILLALSKREYLIRDEATKKYRLGHKVLQFSRVLQRHIDIKDVIRPYLIALGDELKETVHLMRQDGTHSVFIDKIDSPHDIGLLTYIGKRSLLHYSAGGKVILAYMSKAERDAIIQAVGLPGLTKHTITDREVLEHDLRNILVEGFAWNRMEDRDDIIGIAAPLLDAKGKLICAISVAGPSYRFTLDVAREAATTLKAAAATISEKLGHLEQI